MKIADKELNYQALAIEKAQTEIRQLILRSYLSGLSKGVINRLVQNVILKTLKHIKIKTLQRDTFMSLNAFANAQFNTLLFGLGTDIPFIAAILLLKSPNSDRHKRIQANGVVSQRMELAIQKDTKSIFIAEKIDKEMREVTNESGVALQQYSKNYYEKNVKPVLDKLVNQIALDINDISGRNSLRNLAEMEVRYNAHLEQIDNYKKTGVKLVVSSVHADCSKRCYPHQGKVYSLDGSYGTTIDGKPYAPIETATDIYYTTKKGRVYKNGLLGFNCRHNLYEYQPGMIISHVSEKEQRKQYAINTRQRELERTVRRWETEALTYKNIDKTEYQKAMEKVRYWTNEYKRFSHEKARAYYPDRLAA